MGAKEGGLVPRFVVATRAALARIRRAHGPQPTWWPIDDAYHRRHGTDPRFEVCLGAILTQRAAWGRVEEALGRLKRARLLDPERLARAPRARIEAAVRPVGSYRRKAEYLQGFARAVAAGPQALDALLSGSTRAVRQRLLALRGIGPETADAILVYAARRPSFVIDAYTRRVTRRLGLGTGRESYEALQRLWSGGVPATARAHGEAHALLVEHAKHVCTARAPRCDACCHRHVCPRIGVGPPRAKPATTTFSAPNG